MNQREYHSFSILSVKDQAFYIKYHQTDNPNMQNYTNKYVNRRLFSSNNEKFIFYDNYNVKIYNMITGNVFNIFVSNKIVRSAALSADGSQFIYCDDNKYLKFWNLNTLELITEIHLDVVIRSIDFSPDKTKIVCCCTDSSANSHVRIYCLKSFNVLYTIEDNDITLAVFSADSNMVATSDINGDIAVWDLPNNKMLYSYVKFNTVTNKHLSFSACGLKVAFIDVDGKYKIWDVKTGSVVKRFDLDLNNVIKLTYI